MIFPILELEEKVQINDKTRLSAVKTFVSKGENAIQTLTIKPGEDVASAISVFDADDFDERYLDWLFSSFTFDIDSTNNKLYFNDGAGKTATLTTGNYTLAQLATEIKTQLDAESDLTFTVSVDNDVFTISATGEFSLMGLQLTNAILPHIGFKLDTDAKSSHVGALTEYVIKKVTLTATFTVSMVTTTATKVGYTKVYSVQGDRLFSSDSELRVFENDILKWVSQGRASFLDVHRKVQELILFWLDKNGYTDIFGKKYTKFAVIDYSEVHQWATFMALRLIYSGIENAKDDVFKDKAKHYEGLETEARNKFILRLDTNNDGKIDFQDEVNSPQSWSGTVILR